MFASLGGKQEYFVMDAIMVQLFRDESIKGGWRWFIFIFLKKNFYLKLSSFVSFLLFVDSSNIWPIKYSQQYLFKITSIVIFWNRNWIFKKNLDICANVPEEAKCISWPIKKKIEEIYFPWLFICDYRKNLQFDFVILINFYLVPTNVHLWS